MFYKIYVIGLMAIRRGIVLHSGMIKSLCLSPSLNCIFSVKEKFLNRGVIDTVGVNIGIYCNQACSHCHVESSPKRKEMMSHTTAQRLVEMIAGSPEVKMVDITG